MTKDLTAPFPATGVCYYPEHWPEDKWAEDARAMAAAGLSFVRIAEFSWVLMEPKRGQYEFGWLDRAIDTLHQAGLKVILCTPTATPPKWLVDEMPDMLAVDEMGHKRGYGSRRHYSFSHLGYRTECARITEVLAKRYGTHPAVVAWQTDNEYGCHDTALSWCDSAKTRFQDWLRDKYQTIERLNEAWGNLFWSMCYASFDSVELPNLTVTEANPSHNLDFRRFATDEIVAFNQIQTDIIRRYSPDRPIAHNYMGRFNQFDHRPVAADMEIASWDSYPLGFLQDMQQIARKDSQLEADCYRLGDPDFQAFHHDLYRAMGRLWIMEQQPGPVNWAAFNPVPLAGAVRFWSWEAFAHDAELVSYFRWRQAPFAQEQMHAGLNYRDDSPAPGLSEARQVADELKAITLPDTANAPIALIHDYEADWMSELDGQSTDFNYLRLLLDFYRAVRQNGGSVDVIGPKDDIAGYKLILAPALANMHPEMMTALSRSDAQILAGPRTGLKTSDFQLPAELSQSGISELTGFTTTRIDALPARLPIDASWQGVSGQVSVWREEGRVSGQAEGTSTDGLPLLCRGNAGAYLTAWPDEKLLKAIIGDMMARAGLETHDMPPYLRVRRRGNLAIFTHYGPDEVTIPDSFQGTILLGSRQMKQADVTILDCG